MSDTVNATTIFALRLPKSVKAAAAQLAQEEGISLNQLVATALAEKLAVQRTLAFFAQRRDRADLTQLQALLTRAGGVPPQPGNER